MRECNRKWSTSRLSILCFVSGVYELQNGYKDQGRFNRESLLKMKIILYCWFFSKGLRGETEDAGCAGTVASPLDVVTQPMGLAASWEQPMDASASWPRPPSGCVTVTGDSLPQKARGFYSNGAHPVLALLRTFLSSFLFSIIFQTWEVKPQI